MRVDARSATLSSSERRRRAAAIAMWGGLGVFTLLVASDLPGAVWIALAGLAASGVGLWARKSAGRTRDLGLQATFEADAGRLVVSSEGVAHLDVAVEHVDSGWLEEPDHLVIALAGGRQLRAVVASADDARALLDALHVGAVDRVLRVPVYSLAGTMPLGELGTVVVLACIAPFLIAACVAASALFWRVVHVHDVHAAGALAVTALFAALTALVVAAALRFLSRRDVVVGTDGIVIENPARRRVIPVADVTGVTRDEHSVFVQLRSGAQVRLPTARVDRAFPVPASGEQQTRAQVLLRRIADVLEAPRAGRARDKLPLLARNEQPLDTWKRALADLARASGDYRRRSFAADELDELIGDGSLPLEQRTAAAFVLGRLSGATPHAVERVAAATADPRAAEALRAAVKGELTA